MKELMVVLLLVLGVILNPIISQAKDGGLQDQIILLNDSSAALEDSNPELSQKLSELANEKEKDWEFKNSNKDAPSVPITNAYLKQMKDQVKILQAALQQIDPSYPLIIKGLKKMILDMNRIIENGK